PERRRAAPPRSIRARGGLRLLPHAHADRLRELAARAPADGLHHRTALRDLGAHAPDLRRRGSLARAHADHGAEDHPRALRAALPRGTLRKPRSARGVQPRRARVPRGPAEVAGPRRQGRAWAQPEPAGEQPRGLLAIRVVAVLG